MYLSHDLSSLNKRNELVSSYRQRNKALSRDNLIFKHLNFLVYKDGFEYSFNKNCPKSEQSRNRLVGMKVYLFPIFNWYHALP